ncbi:MAG: ABC transporter permease [Ignavibacteria bacterium CG_4_9_14_3_um_filter_36_18]|nr:MAG: ABC transporter permease [Ignavibacteria bacterium CG_4_9_14_3_um_filter_36_18]
MKLLLLLAWRNVWRNKRRSFITLSAVAFAALMAIAMRGIQLGTYALNYKTIIETFPGYIQIQKIGYKKNPSLNKAFVYSENLETKLISMHGVTGSSPRINADGLVSFGDVSLGAAVFGIIPEKEKNVSTIFEKLNEGNFFGYDSTNEIVVGYKLLANLDAKIGDEIVILSQGYDGSLGNMKYKISGTVKTGNTVFDAMAVFIGLKSAHQLLGMDTKVNTIAIKVSSLEKTNPVRNEIKSVINNPELVVLTWEEIMLELKQSMEFDNVSGIFFLGILIIIVAFGILNTVLMSVTERFREFGVVLAIGMPQINLVQVVYIETFFITLLGILIGNIAGYFVNYYIVLNPIILGGGLAEVYAEYNFVPRLESSLDVMIFLNVSISIIVISIISCFYPAYKTYKLEPLKGIRHT